MSIDIGVCTNQDNAMIRKVTHSSWGSAGSVRTVFQLFSPSGWIWPMPSHWVKLRASTPSSGMIANATKMKSAGRAIQVTGPLRPPLEVDERLLLTTGGASDVIGR